MDTFDPQYEDGFYDNEDAYEREQDAMADYRAFREQDELESDDELEQEGYDAFREEEELEESSFWASVERDGYGYFDPHEGCYDD